MKILVACEESQTVCKAFRSAGFEAFSCDIQESSGGFPEWHIQGDAIKEAYSGKYTLMIAHPPCTYLSKAGARWMYPTKGNLCPVRYAKALKAKEFFLKLLNAPIPFIAVENPTPLKVCELPQHSQVVQPFEYGHSYSKRTLLWLKNLPLLKPTKIVKEYKPFLPSNTSGLAKGKGGSRGVARNAKEASVTFTGIAEAMCNQWGSLLKSKELQND